MEMRKCERGHYYDASIHTSCPYCGTSRNTDLTVAMGVSAVSPAIFAGGNGNGIEGTVAKGVQTPVAVPQQNGTVVDNDRTVAIFENENGVDPVVGWLIQLDGKEKGKDYRIHSDNNFIGRGERMDIRIKGDDTISRENQAILTFDSADKQFYFSPGEGRSVVRLNGKAVFHTTVLKVYDKLTIGRTEFLFLPLCGEQFAWDE